MEVDGRLGGELGQPWDAGDGQRMGRPVEHANVMEIVTPEVRGAIGNTRPHDHEADDELDDERDGEVREDVSAAALVREPRLKTEQVLLEKEENKSNHGTSNGSGEQTGA